MGGRIAVSGTLHNDCTTCFDACALNRPAVTLVITTCDVVWVGKAPPLQTGSIPRWHVDGRLAAGYPEAALFLGAAAELSYVAPSMRRAGGQAFAFSAFLRLERSQALLAGRQGDVKRLHP